MFGFAPAPRRLVALPWLAVALLLVFWPAGVAHALPPAGTDTLNVIGQVSITSRTGRESIPMAGTATVQRAAPHTKGSVEVIDAEITALSLMGESVTGPVTVTESASLMSTGEIRSLSDGSFPATSYFNVYAVMAVPASPSPTITLHNDVPLVLSTSSLNSWPPHNATYSGTASPCILLRPSVSNPAQICITSASFTLSSPAVGGVTQLAELRGEAEAAGRAGGRHAWGIALGLLLLAAVGLVARYARSQPRSNW